ncbi:MAG: cation transporter [Anaerolineales bacterium]|nr:cation transporter [Anaerolineales bacterium]
MHNHSHTHFNELTQQTVRRLALSLGITLVFVVVEAVAGMFANSLALLTDAAHNFTDVLALALSWWALRLTSQPANQDKTYGYHRAGILAALANSTTLVVIALGIFYEAYHRFIDPPEVQADVLIGVGIMAVIINVVTALLVRRGAEHDLNIRSAFLHLMGDVLSTIGAVVAGVIIRYTNWNWLDPLVSVLIGILILWSAWSIIREALDILMESTPTDINMDAMVRDITSVDGVHSVHDLHVWSITQSMRTLSAHLVTDDIPISAGAFIQTRVNELLYRKYEISHATLQLECEDCSSALLYCDITLANHRHSSPKY